MASSFGELQLHPLLPNPLDFVLTRVEVELDDRIAGAVAIDLLLRHRENAETRRFRFQAFRRLDGGDGQFDHEELLTGDLCIYIADNAEEGWERPGVRVGHLGAGNEGPAGGRFPTEVFWAEAVEEIVEK